MSFLAAVKTNQVAPNVGHHPDIDSSKYLVTVIIGEKALQHAFRRVVQHGSPGSKNPSGRSEMHVLLQTVFEVAGDGVIEGVAERSAIHHKGGEITVDDVLGCNGGRQ